MVRKKKKKQKTVTYEKYQKKRDVERGNRAEGDKWIYYILHSFITTFIFIVVGIYFEFFILKSDSIKDLFTFDFLKSVFTVFIISIAINIFSRGLAFFALQRIYRKSITRNIWQLNATGVNKLGVRYLMAVMMTSFIFCVGAVIILQEKMLNERNEIASLIIIYIGIKIFVFVFTKLLIEAKG